MNTVWRSQDGDDGVGIVEIMISLLIFAVIMMSLVPFLINTYTTSMKNSTIASATQIVNQQIELARGASSSCTEFSAFASAGAPTGLTDGRDLPLVVTQSLPDVAQCTNKPLQSMTVVVRERTASGRVLATSTVLIAVPRAGA